MSAASWRTLAVILTCGMSLDLGGGRGSFSYAIAGRDGAGPVLALGGIAYGLVLVGMAHSTAL